MVKPKELFELLGLSKQFEQHQDKLQQKQQILTELYEEKMDLSQIEVIYRGEGNANLVLALPQFKKVLRLPKVNVQQQNQQQQLRQEKQQHPIIEKLEGEEHTHKNFEYTYQYQQQQESALTANHQQNGKDDKQVTMEQFAAYIDIIRCLLGNEFVLEVDVVNMSNFNGSYWLNKLIRPHRPVNRLDKEYSGRHCLLLPDATQLPPKFDQLFFNLQAPSNISADTYAIEIKPKQGWLLSDKFYDLMNKKSKTSTGFTMRNKYCHYYTNIPNHGRLQQQQQHYYQMDQSSSSESLKITKCRYCSKQFLKLKQQKIRQLSNYCPLKLFSGSPDKMLEALSALFKCPQNNLRIYRNGQLLYDDHLSKYVNIEAIFTIDQVQVIKYLLIICLLRDYTEENKTGPKANDDNSLKTTPTTTNIATCTAATVGKAKAADLDAAIVSAIASELLNPQTSVGFADLDIKQLQQQQKQQKCEWEQQKAVYKEVLKVREDTPSIMRAAMTSSMPLSATTCLNIQSMHNGTTEMLHLPINCILQKILQLQLLVKKNFFYMFEREYHHKYEKSYNHLQKLLEKFHMNQDILNFSQLNNENEYLLGATALDCSIMITFREVMTSIENLSFPTSLRPYLIEVPELNRRFISKVTLLDLDAKPDNHFAKYCQQTENILKLLQ